jgi:hypothetical protein
MQAFDDVDYKLGHFYTSCGDYYFHFIFSLMMKMKILELSCGVFLSPFCCGHYEDSHRLGNML